MVKRDTIQRYDHLPIREQSHRVIQSWDTAIKVDATNDCSVCATLLVDEHRNYYLLEVLRDRLLYPELKAQAISQAEKHKPDTILIEEGGLGRTLVKDLKAAGLPAVGVVPDPVRALPRDERELFTAASHSHVLAFDNVSGLPPWLSDSLCRLTSGGAFSTRRLFTDQDEILFTAARPIILNGIEDIIIRPDLADRAIVLMLAGLPSGNAGRSMNFGGSSSSPVRTSSVCSSMRRHADCTCCRMHASGGCRVWPAPGQL
jgi:Terminase RNaseH-like domain